MVVHSPLLHMDLGKKPDNILAIKSFGSCSTKGGSWGMYITLISAKQVNKAEPTLAFDTQGETSPGIQNRGTSGPKIDTQL